MSAKITLEISLLNSQQKEAVLHAEGPLLVLAGAGSGKTRVITMRAAHLLDKGILPEQVLAVTFTNKAAREMRDRVSLMLKGGKGGNPPVISTFHSLCLKILRNEIEHLGYKKDFSIYDTSDQASLMRNLMSEVQLAGRSVKLESVMERISRTKNGMIVSSEIEENEDDDLGAISLALYERYQRALKAFNAVDFDDLLLLTLKLFKEHPQVLERYRDRYRYIMVDEYQDTNRIQYDFLRLLAGDRKNLCVVGDDDQSIYGWRGADIGNILGFEKDFPGAKIVRLEHNYRSCGYILRAANGVIGNNKKRMAKSLRTEQGLGPKVKIFRALDSEDEAAWISDKISLIKYEKKRPYEDFAVIYRANTLSRPFEEALRKERIPYTVVGGMSYFDRREIKDLAAYLRIIANPRDDLSLLRASNTPKRGLGSTTIEKFAAFARNNAVSLFEAFRKADEVNGLSEKSVSTTSGFTGLIEKYVSLFEGSREMGKVLKDLIREIHYKDYLFELYKTPEAAAKRVENVDGFIESLIHYEEREISPSLRGFLETMSLVEMEEIKEEEAKGVTLISLHSSKGLEFPVVFIVGAEEDILPHKKSVYSGDIEEERRLMYVGITRAMKELYITYTCHRIKYGKEEPSMPSRFIEEIPDTATESLNRADEDNSEESERKARDFFANIQAMLGD